MTSRRIMVAGGGIGGLSAALSLAGQGLEVTLFEQAEAFGEVGAGIQLSPNATRVLFDLGLEDPLRSLAFTPERAEIRAWDSAKLISSSALGAELEAATGYPYLHLHRADLIAVLADAARLTPRIRLQMGEAINGYVQSPERVAVTSRGETWQGDVLVGADGIHSSIRERLHGERAPRFTGNVAYRALVPVDTLRDLDIPPVAGLWWGPGAHFVHYFVRRGELLNCVCVMEASHWRDEGWMIPGSPGELRRAFHGWHPTLQGLMDRMDPASVFKWALYDREPMPVWRSGRVTLLGDACHPGLPFMAQGAAMAIEDGAVLSRCLSMNIPVDAALQRYEDRRRQRTTFVQMASRRNARVYHLRGLPALLRNLAASRASAGTLQKLFTYDALSAHL